MMRQSFGALEFNDHAKFDSWGNNYGNGDKRRLVSKGSGFSPSLPNR
jgi:hypothetical protein